MNVVPLQTVLDVRDILFTAVILPILVLWILVNVYIYYPVVRVSLERHARRGRRGLRVLAFGADDGGQTSTGSGDETGIETASADLPDEELPTMAVLLPAYKESTVIEQSIRSSLESDYPDEKFELYVLTEPDDDETVEVLDPLSETRDFEHVVVPSRYPDDPTKPRALNYGFEHSDEEIVCVIDAEDIVQSDMFRKAAAEIVVGDLDYAQARLDMVNEDDGWLNTMFRADYGYWFRAVLPSFAAVGYPMPLGGTSNFFRRSTLGEIHELRMTEYGDRWDERDWAWAREHGLDGVRPWDPRNVTEDFELGLFLWKEGYEFAYIDAVTREESPLTLDGWIRQRTRWKKGKLYTHLQYRETPPDSPKAKFHLFMQSMLPHMGPVNIAGIVITLMIANIARFGPGNIVMGGEFLGLAFVGFAMYLHSREYWNVSEKRRTTRTQRAIQVALTLPFYWILQWGADIRAIYQTYNGRPDEWELTKHFGRNRDTDDEPDQPVSDETRTQSATALDSGTDPSAETVDQLTEMKVATELPTEEDPEPERPVEVTEPTVSDRLVGTVDERGRLAQLFDDLATLAVLVVVTLVALAVRLFDLTAWSLSGSELHWVQRAAGPTRGRHE